MSARHPTPWTIGYGSNGERGMRRREWANILDARKIFVDVAIDCETAREIAEAVNERAALRDLVRRFADGVRNYRFASGPETNELIREAREVLGEGAQ